MPPRGRLAQSRQDIPISWDKGPYTSEEVVLNYAIVAIPSYSGCGIERYIEGIVHAPFVRFAACLLGLLLVQRDVAKACECRRQIPASFQMLPSLSGVMSNLPNMASILPEARI